MESLLTAIPHTFPVFYNTDGIPTDRPTGEKFWIQYIEPVGNFIFKEGDITLDIDTRCIELRYEIAKRLFGSTDIYHRFAAGAPIVFPYAGIDAEIKISKEEFEVLAGKWGQEEVANKLFYYYDITNLLDTLQNSVLESKYLIGQFYRTLNENDFLIAKRTIADNGVQFAAGPIVVNIMSTINHLFINLYSQLDFITKFVVEFEKLATDFSVYPKLKSRDILFGDAKKTSLLNLPGSLFEPAENIKKIVTLRNEIVHNASIDSTLKVYQVIKDKELIEKFILLPDFKDGILKTFKNRRRFFNDGMKLNEVLPELIIDFWHRLKTTLDAIQ